jgi:hypothetical protein
MEIDKTFAAAVAAALDYLGIEGKNAKQLFRGRNEMGHF